MIRLLVPAAALALLAAPSLAAPQHHAPKPKLTMAQARVIALRAAPGRVVKAEYENEDGGWRYSFDIRQGKRIHEIGVDANSGKIVENVFEDPRHPD